MKINEDIKNKQPMQFPLSNGGFLGNKQYLTVEALLIKFDVLPDYLFSIHKLGSPYLNEWVVSEISTGMKVCESHTKQKAINLAKNKLENHKDSFDSIIKKSKSKLKKEGFPFPINSI